MKCRACAKDVGDAGFLARCIYCSAPGDYCLPCYARRTCGVCLQKIRTGDPTFERKPYRDVIARCPLQALPHQAESILTRAQVRRQRGVPVPDPIDFDGHPTVASAGLVVTHPPGGPFRVTSYDPAQLQVEAFPAHGPVYAQVLGGAPDSFKVRRSAPGICDLSLCHGSYQVVVHTDKKGDGSWDRKLDAPDASAISTHIEVKRVTGRHTKAGSFSGVLAWQSNPLPTGTLLLDACRQAVALAPPPAMPGPACCADVGALLGAGADGDLLWQMFRAAYQALTPDHGWPAPIGVGSLQECSFDLGFMILTYEGGGGGCLARHNADALNFQYEPRPVPRTLDICHVTALRLTDPFSSVPLACVGARWPVGLWKAHYEALDQDYISACFEGLTASLRALSRGLWHVTLANHSWLIIRRESQGGQCELLDAIANWRTIGYWMLTPPEWRNLEVQSALNAPLQHSFSVDALCVLLMRLVDPDWKVRAQAQFDLLGDTWEDEIEGGEEFRLANHDLVDQFEPLPGQGVAWVFHPLKSDAELRREVLSMVAHGFRATVAANLHGGAAAVEEDALLADFPLRANDIVMMRGIGMPDDEIREQLDAL